MSIVTDRLNDQNIINIARQQYEQQQKSTLPGYSVPLTSGGTVYPASSPLRVGSVELRYMTAYEEDILTNPSYINDGSVISRVIDSLIITPGVTADDLINPDLFGCVVAARIKSYGNMYPVQITLPNGNIDNRDIDLSAIPYKQFNLKSDENGEFDYTTPMQNHKLKFKFLPLNLTKLINSNQPISGLIRQSVTEVNGNRDRNYIEQFVQYELIGGDSRKFREYISDNMPGLDLTLQFEGEKGSTFTSKFQLGSELLWF
jgi:hypothetical protein